VAHDPTTAGGAAPRPAAGATWGPCIAPVGRPACEPWP
jgi:hypothetical protein